MRALRTLKDHIFRSREELFNWELSRCAELNASINVTGDAENQGEDENEPGFTFEGEAHRQVCNEYFYRRNKLVTIKPAGDTSQSIGPEAELWIEKVSEIKEIEQAQ